jgi:hypothetical protein
MNRLSASFVTAMLTAGCGSSTSGPLTNAADGGMVDVSCNHAPSAIATFASCRIANVASSQASAEEADCATNGGTLVTACPAAGLSGCCNFGDRTATCYYNGGASDNGCSTGDWTTTLP